MSHPGSSSSNNIVVNSNPYNGIVPQSNPAIINRSQAYDNSTLAQREVDAESLRDLRLRRFQSETASLRSLPSFVGSRHIQSQHNGSLHSQSHHTSSRHSQNEDEESNISDLTSAVPVIGRFLNHNTTGIAPDGTFNPPSAFNPGADSSIQSSIWVNGSSRQSRLGNNISTSLVKAQDEVNPDFEEVLTEEIYKGYLFDKGDEGNQLNPMWDAYQKESVENGGAISRKPLGPTDPQNMEHSNNHRSDLGPVRDATAINTYDGTILGPLLMCLQLLDHMKTTIFIMIELKYYFY